MTLQQLNYIITISEIGSINRAAEKLYVSQPSLTSAIKELEKELGIVLFNRTARGVTLTAEGVDFLPYARQVYGQYLNLLEKYGKAGERKQRFGVSCQHYSFAVKAFVEMVKAYDVAKYEFAIRETKTLAVIGAGAKEFPVGKNYSGPYQRDWTAPDAKTPLQYLTEYLDGYAEVIFAEDDRIEEIAAQCDAALYMTTVVEGEGMDRSDIRLPGVMRSPS